MYGPPKPSGVWIKASGSSYCLFTLFFLGSLRVICEGSLSVLRIIANWSLTGIPALAFLKMKPLLCLAEGCFFLLPEVVQCSSAHVQQDAAASLAFFTPAALLGRQKSSEPGGNSFQAASSGPGASLPLRSLSESFVCWASASPSPSAEEQLPARAEVDCEKEGGGACGREVRSCQGFLGEEAFASSDALTKGKGEEKRVTVLRVESRRAVSPLGSCTDPGST
ncbi:uncharacterized protein LOC142360815 isoform X4 [Opisthocomus hoazin]|uniref:uncharacterized protein LOC142360815 isoform X4 n=1 Tax=Opisthocomus hoazin TaxID=30419 RepID=UPI003F534DE2